MKNLLILLAAALALVSCRSVDFPTVEESQKIIDLNKHKIDSLNTLVESRKPAIKLDSDLQMNLSLSSVNKVIEPVANSKQEDISVTFRETKPLFKEDKNIFGISYTNYLNVDGGNISVNLKKFRFDRLIQNKIDANIELEGKGNISVSGKYTAIPASATPLIELYLYEPITFLVLPDGRGSLILKAEPKRMVLKTKTSIKLLEWYVPWYQEVPLELTDLIQPVILPLGFKTEIGFPLPSSKNGNEKIEMAPYLINLNDTKLVLENNKIEFKTNVDFIKK